MIIFNEDRIKELSNIATNDLYILTDFDGTITEEMWPVSSNTNNIYYDNDNFKLGNCAEVETIEGSRGGTSYANIHIHSVRMPGYIASQEVIFGASGQILKVRHDSMDRKCYMQGVLLAVRHTFNENDFVYGLDNIL
mgnify:CR=1 FL=1